MVGRGDGWYLHVQLGRVVGGVEAAVRAARVGAGVQRARRLHAQRPRARQEEARVQVAATNRSSLSASSVWVPFPSSANISHVRLPCDARYATVRMTLASIPFLSD